MNMKVRITKSIYSEGLLLIKLLIIFGMTTILVSCAGPYTPFGAVNSYNSKSTNFLDLEENPLEVKISLFPERQVLHRVEDFKILIEDVENIPDNYVFEVYYDRKNITKDFLKNSRVTIKKNQLHIIYEDLSLDTSKDHEIYIKYQNNPTRRPKIVKYKAPECNINYIQERELENELLSKIFYHSNNNGINPFLITGLIAQESSFNHKAVSSAKAIGLTKVTALAEKHIIEEFPSWPTYPNLNKQSKFRIEAMISNDEVNPGNEWRLNHDKSILGSIHFIKYIQKFWQKDRSLAVLDRNLYNRKVDKNNIPLEIILASYNSGPFRVKRAIQRMGDNWLKSDQLNEARKYVRRIKSYCHAFKKNLPQEKNFFAQLKQYQIDKSKYSFGSRLPATENPTKRKLKLISKFNKR